MTTTRNKMTSKERTDLIELINELTRLDMFSHFEEILNTRKSRTHRKTESPSSFMTPILTRNCSM